MPSKILFILPSLEIDGNSIQASVLARRLLSSPFEPRILCLQGEGALAASVRKSGVPVDSLDLGQSGTFKGCLQVRRYCIQHDIDIAHTLLGDLDYLAVRGARAAGVPTVITSRRKISDSADLRLLRIRKAANKRTSVVVCDSQAVLDAASQAEGFPQTQARVIAPGFPEESIPALPLISSRPAKKEALRPYQIQEKELVLVCIANFTENKNHFRLLDALRKVLLEGLLVRLFLIGDGPTRAEVDRYVENLSLRMAVVFLGHRVDRLKFLAEADALVLPSLSDGIPSALLEAQALGIPAIGSRMGGIPELLQHGETGWTFDPTSVGEIAKAMWTVLSRNEDAAHCAARGQERIRRLFSAREMTAKYASLYGDLCSA
jgi:glycosyltransferase involved in cell wall biosynthesis